MLAKIQRNLIILLAYIAIPCIADEITSEVGIKVYKAKISPIADSHINVSGEVVAFVPPDGKFTGFIGFGGYLLDIEENIDADNCPSIEGCGVSINSGDSCDDARGQYFNFDESINPWLDEKYSSDSSGKAVFSSLIPIGTDISDGFPVVVYDKLGFRIGCGMLEEVDPFTLFETEISPMSDSGIHGEVLMYQKPIDSSQILPICYYGVGSGLEPDIECSNNDFLDACGTHVHAGNSCASGDDQGQAFFNSLVVNFNPWKNLRFLSTDNEGNTQFMHCVHTGEAAYEEKVFILHNQDGSRAACGELKSVATRTSSQRLYVAWILLGFLVPGMSLPFLVKCEGKLYFRRRRR